MKPYFIYFFNSVTQQPETETGHSGYLKAKSEIDALRKFHKALNSIYQSGNFFRSSTYFAVPAF